MILHSWESCVYVNYEKGEITGQVCNTSYNIHTKKRMRDMYFLSPIQDRAYQDRPSCCRILPNSESKFNADENV